MSEPLVIWRLSDGKPGHMQQSLGLVRALQQFTSCEVFDIDMTRHPVGLVDLLRSRFPAPDTQRQPRLVIGAGHATHLGLLAAKRATGAHAVVLMKPSLPAFLFDSVIAPRHDGMAESPRVLNTRGVLNPMQPAGKQANSLLFLLGGESKHARWDDAVVLRQLEALVQAQPGADWCMADSRRTPEALSKELHGRYGNRFQPWQNCPPGWLAQRLASTETVWVSEDSVSMLYEALTAGCRVGLLTLPGRDEKSRVMRGIQELVRANIVTRFEEWAAGERLLPVAPGFNEAARAAEWLLARLRTSA